MDPEEGKHPTWPTLATFRDSMGVFSRSRAKEKSRLVGAHAVRAEEMASLPLILIGTRGSGK